MKKLLSALFLSIFLVACGSFSDPISYNTMITDLVTDVDTSYETYNKTKKQNNNDTIILQTQLEKTTKNIQKIFSNIESQPAYQDDDAYLNAAITYISQTLSLLNNEEKKLLGLYIEVAQYPNKKRTPDIERSYKKEQQIIVDAINTQIQKDILNLYRAQQSFATKHNLTLTRKK